MTWHLVAVFGMALAGTVLSQRLGHLWGVVDHPGALKLQTHDIPRLGGLGILAGIVLGVALDWTSSRLLLGGALLMFAVGVIDDRYGLRPAFKLGGQVLSALLLAYSLSYLGRNEQVGMLELTLITVFAIVVLANALNLLDGMDGLAGGTAAVAFTAIAVLQFVHGLRWTVAAIGAAAVLGFLPLNFPRARIFMGDCGSLLLGFLLGYELIQLAAHSITLFLCGLVILTIPLFDLTTGILRRLLAKRPIFSGDREHFYDRLRLAGLGNTRVVSGILFVAALLGALGVFLSLYAVQVVIIAGALLSIVLLALSQSLGWLGRREGSIR